MDSTSKTSAYARRVAQVVVYGKAMSALFPVLNQQPTKSRGSAFFVRLPTVLAPGRRLPLLNHGQNRGSLRYLLTAAHVVEDAFPENGVKVVLPVLGQQELPARVVCLIPEIDLAVLSLDDAESYEKFTDAFEIGNDHDLVFGSDTPILVLGYPLGQDQLKALRCNFSGRQDIGIQTDCALNQGNSGGPVVYKGKVMGWVSSGVSPSLANNISWAVPINQFRAVLPLILDAIQKNSGNPEVLHVPHTGIMYHNSSPVDNTAECQGVVIQFIAKESILQGFANVGDKLCSVEFRGIDESRRGASTKYALDSRGEVAVPWHFAKLPFAQISGEIPVGEPVTFHVWDSRTRNVKSKTAPLTFPNRGGFLYHALRYEPLDYEMFAGLLIMPFRGNHVTEFPQLRASMKPSEREQDSLIVTHLVPGSEAYGLNVINPGDILRTVNDREVHNLSELRDTLAHPITVGNGKKAVKFETIDNASIILDMDMVMQKEAQYREQTGTKPSSLSDFVIGS